MVLPGETATGYFWELSLPGSNALKPDKADFFADNKALRARDMEVIPKNKQDWR
jgi:predicted secreted protein